MKTYEFLGLGLISLICFIASVCEAKTVQINMRLSQLERKKNIYYVTKFAMDVGRGEYIVKGKFSSSVASSANVASGEIELGFSVLIDHDWERFDGDFDCSALRQRSSSNTPMFLPTNGAISKESKGYLTSRRRRHVWFFVVNDCARNLKDIPRWNTLDVTLEIFNVDSSHYPSDEGNFVWGYFSVFIIFAVIFLRNIKKLKNKYIDGEEHDWPLLLQQVALGLWALSQAMYWLHWLIYGENGRGLWFVDLLAEIFSNCSAVVLTVVLIMLSWGWTVIRRGQQFYDFVIPLSIIIGAFQLMIVGLGKLTDDSSYKYHQYDGWPGYILLFIRIALGAYFLFGVKMTVGSTRGVVKSFVYQLGFFGLLYLLSFPLLLGISLFIPPYVQHSLIKIGFTISQSIALLSLEYLFTSNSTNYYSIAEQGSATPLPNFKSE